MRTIIAILLLLACVSARADEFTGYNFKVAPNPVPVGTAIGVTIETVGVPCMPLSEELWITLREGGVVRLYVPGSDGCNGVVQETRHYTIDPLPPGRYFFQFYTCGGLDADTGEDACQTIEEIPVTVLGVDAQRRTIPTLSTAGLFVMVLAALAMAALLRDVGLKATPHRTASKPPQEDVGAPSE